MGFNGGFIYLYIMGFYHFMVDISSGTLAVCFGKSQRFNWQIMRTSTAFHVYVKVPDGSWTYLV